MENPTVNFAASAPEFVAELNADPIWMNPIIIRSDRLKKGFASGITFDTAFHMGSPKAGAKQRYINAIKGYTIRHPYWVLAFITFATLAPFLAKPFNMDDPLFVWAAQQIHSHFGNPYGFYVNWFGFDQPMWQATQNPPLMSYYLAAAAEVFGWTEPGLHTACLLPAVAAVLGTYRLAMYFCTQPFFVALATLLAPGFLVSSNTVMSDVFMLALWIWAVVFWVEGLSLKNNGKLAAAGICVGLAVLTKYNAVCLIPLLAAFGWLEKRSLGSWLFFLLIPVVMLCGNEWLTFQLYGAPHFLTSNQFTKSALVVNHTPKLFKLTNALSFTGGTFAIMLFCAPCLWKKRWLALFIAISTVIAGLAFSTGMILKSYDSFADGTCFRLKLQILLWSTGGVCLLALVGADVWRRRDARSWLLALWVGGTFVFVLVVYWMVNGRALLPLIPAAAILVARRLEQSHSSITTGIKFSLVASAALSLLAAEADFQQASLTRKKVEQICAKYVGNRTLWFEGHWGFQYYMQSLGALPLDSHHIQLQSGDLVIVPTHNSNFSPPEPFKLTELEVVVIPAFPGLALMNQDAGAGFYSSLIGPLPFTFGQIPPENIFVCVAKKPPQPPD